MLTEQVKENMKFNALVRDRNRPQKVVWRARIVLLGQRPADGRGDCRQLARACSQSAAGAVAMSRREWTGLLKDPPVAREAFVAREDQAGRAYDTA